MANSQSVPGPFIPDSQRRAAALLDKAEDALERSLDLADPAAQVYELTYAETAAVIAAGLLALNPPPRRYRPRPAPEPRVVKL